MTDESDPGDPSETPTAVDHAARHELFSALILAAATILTAYAAFQAASWVNSQTMDGAAASVSRVASSREIGLATAFRQVDVTFWTAWDNAVLSERRTNPGQTLTPDGRYLPVPGTDSYFYYSRFRKEFRPAVDAWLATNPFNDPHAPPVPFTFPQYRLPDEVLANKLDQRAQTQARRATNDGGHARDYVLLTVVFASALAFAGASIKLRTRRAREITLLVSAAVLVVAAGFMLTLPVNL